MELPKVLYSLETFGLQTIGVFTTRELAEEYRLATRMQHELYIEEIVLNPSIEYAKTLGWCRVSGYLRKLR